MEHKSFLERISESDHELLIEDLEDETADGEELTDDAADDVDDSGVVEVDPETLVVTEEVSGSAE